MNDIIIPEIFPDLTTSKVLTMSMVHGEHLNEWLIKKPSQKERANYGQMLVELFKHSLFQNNFFHADPNPGNYLFRSDNKLGLIDFGCVKNVSNDFSRSIKKGADLADELSPQKLKKFYDAIGFSFNRKFDESEFYEFLETWIEWVTRPQRKVSFDFSRSEEYMSEGTKYYSFIERVDGEFVFFARSLQGLMRMLQTLCAKVDMRF